MELCFKLDQAFQLTYGLWVSAVQSPQEKRLRSLSSLGTIKPEACLKSVSSLNPAISWSDFGLKLGGCV